MSTHSSTPPVDLDARYAVAGWEGIAFWIKQWPMQTQGTDYEWSGIPDEDPEWAIVVMVGDNRPHAVEVAELTMIPEDGYCAGCGQIGCPHS
jgi:hypothetical protein